MISTWTLSPPRRFLLRSFKELVILWQRLRLETKAAPAGQLDDHRFSLRLLLGAHLMEIARQAESTEVYAEALVGYWSM